MNALESYRRVSSCCLLLFFSSNSYIVFPESDAQSDARRSYPKCPSGYIYSSSTGDCEYKYY